MRPTLSLLGVLAIFALGVPWIAGGDLDYLLDIPTVFLVVVPTALFLVVAFTPAELTAWGSLAVRGREATGADPGAALRVCESGRRVTLASGALGALTGFVWNLGNLDDPSKLGPGLAVAVLPELLALLVAEVFFEAARMAVLSRATGVDVPRRDSLPILAAYLFVPAVGFLLVLLGSRPFPE